MNALRLLLLLFVLVPLAEIYLLIKAGGAIGAAWTIALVVLTAVTGAALVRQQSFTTLRRARANLQHRQLPTLELLEGACLLVAGALLLTPGFITDAVGFALLTPPLRRALIVHVIKRWARRHLIPLEGEWREYRHDD